LPFLAGLSFPAASSSEGTMARTAPAAAPASTFITAFFAVDVENAARSLRAFGELPRLGVAFGLVAFVLRALAFALLTGFFFVAIPAPSQGFNAVFLSVCHWLGRVVTPSVDPSREPNGDTRRSPHEVVDRLSSVSRRAAQEARGHLAIRNRRFSPLGGSTHRPCPRAWWRFTGRRGAVSGTLLLHERIKRSKTHASIEMLGHR
jgi:hypothetical protein